MTDYQFLNPYTFKNGMTVKNRVVIPPMTERSGLEDGSVSRDELYYASLRTGGVGMFVTPAANVTATGKGFEGELAVNDDCYIPRLAQLAATIKQNGTKAILQLIHAGRMTNSRILRGTQPVSASAIAAPRDGMETPRALSETEIKELVVAFAMATRRAILAGFDGVEIHGANTYLIQQFFSPNSNQRSDQWGGSVTNRMRFGLEIVNAAKMVIDQYAQTPFLLGYRISPEEVEKPGIRLADTLQFVDRLADSGIDYLHVSMGNAWRKSLNDLEETRPTILRIRDQVHNRVPLISVGGLQSPADVEKVMDAGITFAALGREYLREPKWVQKVEAGLEETIRYRVNRTELEDLGLNPALLDFLDVIGTDLGYVGETDAKTSDRVDAIFKD